MQSRNLELYHSDLILHLQYLVPQHLHLKGTFGDMGGLSELCHKCVTQDQQQLTCIVHNTGKYTVFSIKLIFFLLLRVPSMLLEVMQNLVTMDK